MSHGKQFTIYTHIAGPNGVKVCFVLNELGLTYEPRYLEFNDIKSLEHTQYNPNGRIPTLIDHHNGDFVLWESNAIILYLIEHYDKDHKISVTSPRDKAVLNQWLFFQASGQGPYFGQINWFKYNHPEKIPAAIERYQTECRRILTVLEGVLNKQDYLVGGKLTVADIVWVPWNILLKPVLLGEDFKFEEEFPRTAAWHARVTTVEGVKKGLEERLRLIAEDNAKKAAAAANA